MFDLKCKRMGCKFNKNCNCTAKNVDVTKDTICKTYIPSPKDEKNVTEKIGQPPIRKNISVECKANCIFNDKCICTANGITVQTVNAGTNSGTPKCCTFQPD